MAFRTNKTPVLQEKSASGAVATFNTALAMPLASCNIAVNAWQEGSGDPSPVNNRPIHGFSEVNAVNSRIVPVNKLIPITATQEGSGEPSPTNIRPIHAGLTIVRDDDSVLEIYGGTLDVISGELSVTHTIKILNGGTSEVWYFREPSNGYYHVITQMKRQTLGDGISSWLPTKKSLNAELGIVFGYNNSAIYAVKANTLEGVTDVDSWKQYLSNHNLQVVYGLETPEVIQLSATELARAKEALGIDIYTMQLGEEIFGASVDFKTGVAHVNKQILVFTGTESWTFASSTQFFYVTKPITNAKSYKTDFTSNGIKMTLYSSGIIRVYVSDNQQYIDSSTDLNQILTNGIQFLYDLAEPFDIQLTPTQIETLIGNNTIFADTGDIDLTYKDLDIAKRGNFREVFKLPS